MGGRWWVGGWVSYGGVAEKEGYCLEGRDEEKEREKADADIASVVKELGFA